MVSDKLKESIEAFLLGAVYPLLPAVIFSLYASFVEGGFTTTEFFNLSNFYWIIGTIFTFFLFIFALAEVLGLDKSKSVFGSIAKMVMLIDPQKGLIGNLTPTVNKFLGNFFNVFILGLILFSIIGLIQVQQNQFFTELPAVSQQVTEVGKGIYSVFPGADAETVMFIVFAIIQLGLLHYFTVVKGKMKYDKFLVLALFIIAPLIGVEGMGFHSLRYAGSEISLFNVWLFWTLNAVIYIFTGVMVFWFVWHEINNLFFYLSKLEKQNIVTNESITLLVITILIVLIVIWVGFRLRAKNKTLSIQTPNG